MSDPRVARPVEAAEQEMEGDVFALAALHLKPYPASYRVFKVEVARLQAAEREWKAIAEGRAELLDRVRDELKAAKADLARLRGEAVPQWQPIETAPNDGTCVLLWWPFWMPSRPVIGFFGLRGIQQWFAAESLEGDGDGPTHWMSLPAPPASEDTP